MSIQDCKQDMLRIGVDVGSTTVKLLVLDPDDQIVFSVYRRHHSDVRATIVEIIDEALEAVGDGKATITITGSGGLLLANWLGVPFVQEVIANKTAIERIIPATDVAIELGGEDAKIIYFDGGIEQRMNGTCAGGTGAFIDQMAALLNTDASGLDEMAKEHNIIYPIASRCGVFAKTDVQPLLNEGAKREDIAASIFQAVVMQTISGLACGRPIRGNVAFLGGPLHYLPQLRQRFIETLELTDETTIIPEESHLFVARGAAFASEANVSSRCSRMSANTRRFVSVMPRQRCPRRASRTIVALPILASMPDPRRSSRCSWVRRARSSMATTSTTRATCSGRLVPCSATLQARFRAMQMVIRS